MRRKLGITILATVLVGLAGEGMASGQGNASRYVPPDLTAAGNIVYPVNTTTTGLVTLMVSLDNSAQVQNVQVLRDVSPLTSSAQTAVQGWNFRAATSNGNPVASNIPVSVVFNPFNPGGTELVGMSVPPVPSAPVSGTPQFTPPQITSATFALYPPNSLAQGTVVLSVTIGRSGQASKVRVIQGVQDLTTPAVNAVKNWSYSSATLKGQPIAAKMAVAFVFQRNLN